MRPSPLHRQERPLEFLRLRVRDVAEALASRRPARSTGSRAPPGRGRRSRPCRGVTAWPRIPRGRPRRPGPAPWSGRCTRGSRRPAAPCRGGPPGAFPDGPDGASPRSTPGSGRRKVRVLPRARAPMSRVPRTACAASAAARPRRAQASVLGKSSAMPRARARAVSDQPVLRSCFTNSPVSMETGQAVAQRPSVAHVSSPQVGEVLCEARLPSRRVLASASEPGHLPRTTIRWRGVVVTDPRRALRLAEAALDALVDHRVRRRQRLQVLQVDVRVVVEDDARVEESLRIE